MKPLSRNSRTRLNLFLMLVLIVLTFVWIAKKKEQNEVYSLQAAANAGQQQPVIPDRTNELHSIKIFCLIMRSQKSEEEMKKEIVWLADGCDGIHFIDKQDVHIQDLPHRESFEPLEVFKVPLSDAQKQQINQTHYQNTENIFKAIREVYTANHANNNVFDWYLKADDDTFIFTYNLRDFLLTKNPNDPVSFGYNLEGRVKDKEPKPMYHSGAAGYVMSRESFNALGMNLQVNDRFCGNNANEDVDVALCLHNVKNVFGASVESDGRERFHPFDIRTHIDGTVRDWWHYHITNPVRNKRTCCSEETISFHGMSKDDMKRLHGLWLDFKEYVMDVDTPDAWLIRFTTILYQYAFP